MGETAINRPDVIERLAKHHNRSAFSCGQETLDRYLQTQASQEARRYFAAPFVLVEAGKSRVWGYYTLSARGIELDHLPVNISKKLPRYPQVPATLLGRLAVDRRLQGQKLGEFLLQHALRSALEQSGRISAAAVVVDAIDDMAHRFYLHYGFIPFPDRPDRLFLPMETIAKLFR
jgi:GNAT superfamily N-acetyltransferase